MAWYFNCPGGASLKITNPVGFDVTAIYTMLIVARPLTTAVDGRTIVKLGDPDSGQDTGIVFGFNSAEKPKYRNTDGADHVHATTLSMAGAFYNLGLHSAGSAVAHRGITVDGSFSSANFDPPANLIAGDQFSVAYSAAGIFAAPDVEIAMLAWLHDSNFDGADVENYCNDPCALITDFGPGGAEDADALKLLLLGNLTVDLSGNGNHPTIVGGSSVSGPTDYPVACGAAASGPLIGGRLVGSGILGGRLVA